MVFVVCCCGSCWWCGFWCGPPSAGPPSEDRPKFRACFSVPRHQPPISLFCLSLCVFSMNFGGFCENRDPQMCTFGLSGCGVKPGRFTPPKKHEKTPRERQKAKVGWQRGKKKAQIFGPPTLRGPRASGPHRGVRRREGGPAGGGSGGRGSGRGTGPAEGSHRRLQTQPHTTTHNTQHTTTHDNTQPHTTTHNHTQPHTTQHTQHTTTQHTQHTHHTISHNTHMAKTPRTQILDKCGLAKCGQHFEILILAKCGHENDLAKFGFFGQMRF